MFPSRPSIVVLEAVIEGRLFLLFSYCSSQSHTLDAEMAPVAILLTRSTKLVRGTVTSAIHAYEFQVKWCALH